MYWFMELFLTKCRTSHFRLFNFVRVLSAHFSSLSRTLWMASQPDPVVQPLFSALHSLLIQPILRQLLYKDLMGDSVEILTEV